MPSTTIDLGGRQDMSASLSPSTVPASRSETYGSLFMSPDLARPRGRLHRRPRSLDLDHRSQTDCQRAHAPHGRSNSWHSSTCSQQRPASLDPPDSASRLRQSPTRLPLSPLRPRRLSFSRDVSPHIANLPLFLKLVRLWLEQNPDEAEAVRQKIGPGLSTGLFIQGYKGEQN